MARTMGGYATAHLQSACGFPSVSAPKKKIFPHDQNLINDWTAMTDHLDTKTEKRASNPLTPPVSGDNSPNLLGTEFSYKDLKEKDLDPPAAPHPTPVHAYFPTSAFGPASTNDTMISSLPIIDISSFLDPSSTPEARQSTALAISAACMDYGFFYLTGHGIPASKLDQIIDLARQFFFSPLEEKNKIKRHDAGGPEGGDGARGYQGMGENITLGRRDVQEAVDLYREWDNSTASTSSSTSKTHKTLQGPNLWPISPPELKSVYLDYISQLQNVGAALVRAMGVSLDLGAPSPDATATTEDSEIFVRNTDRSFWVMRMIGYPPLSTPLKPGEDPTEFSCGEHSDYGCVTLLLADPTPGALQVLAKDNTTWIAADPIPGAFVVNIGDMIERWTNGLWKSTRHRVIHRGDGYRVSVPFFYEPNFEAVVKPLGRLVERTGGREVHGGSTYGEHLMGKVFSNFYND